MLAERVVVVFGCGHVEQLLDRGDIAGAHLALDLDVHGETVPSAFVTEAQRVRPRSPKGRAKATARALAEAYPDAACARTHRNPFELLVATSLSAQANDEQVNKVMPALFTAFPTPQALAGASTAHVE